MRWRERWLNFAAAVDDNGAVRSRDLTSLILLVLVAGAVAPGGAVAQRSRDDSAEGLAAVTGPARDVTATSTVLTGTVTPDDPPTRFFFEYGTTVAYGTSTPVRAVRDEGDDDPVAVSAPVAGLQPATTYHFRLRAAERERVVAGGDIAFTTAPAAAAPAMPTPVAPTVATAVPAPVLAEQIVVEAVGGVVNVRPPAAPAARPLVGPEALAVGTVVDARAGTARVTTAVDRSGGVQNVLLRDGMVEIRQAARSGAIVELRLRGGNFAACGRSARRARAAVAARRRRPPRRSLWAHETRGQFRTRGRNSVATVRGTTWRTTDTCRGTTTSVTSGSVVVRNLRTGRRVVVRAGGRYLARSRR
jgi:hypothetical protein